MRIPSFYQARDPVVSQRLLSGLFGIYFILKNSKFHKNGESLSIIERGCQYLRSLDIIILNYTIINNFKHKMEMIIEYHLYNKRSFIKIDSLDRVMFCFFNIFRFII